MGEAGQKDKITCISLMHQINEAKVAGYDDDDIMNGVIRATDQCLWRDRKTYPRKNNGSPFDRLISKKLILGE